MAIYKGLVVPPGATYLIAANTTFYKELKIEGLPSRLSAWPVGATKWEDKPTHLSVLEQHYKECLLPNQFQIEAWLEENKDD